MKPEELPRVFVLGCQRSGTTLMRLVLNSHPNIHCYGEIKGYGVLEGNRPWDDFPQEIRAVGFQLPIWTELFVEYDCIRQHLRPQDNVVFMLRDVLSVVASMKKVSDKSKVKGAWMQREIVSRLNDWLKDQARGLQRNYGEVLERAKGHPHEDVIRAAVYWQYKTGAFFQMEALPVYYNSFVHDPAPTLRKVMEMMRLSWSDQLLEHHKKKHDETGKNGWAMGGTDSARPIDLTSVDKWRDVLSQGEIGAILNVAGDMDQKLRRYA